MVVIVKYTSAGVKACIGPYASDVEARADIDRLYASDNSATYTIKVVDHASYHIMPSHVQTA